MRKFKKVISVLTSTAIAATASMALSASSASAAVSVLLGDANGDNKVTLADVAAVHQYLGGYGAVSAKSFTGMDVNQDKIIDSTDAYIIQYRLAYNIPAPTVQKELYTLPDDSTRTYLKYTCDTGVTTSYTLSNSTASSNADFDYPIATVSEEFDNENTNVVQFSIHNGDNTYIGSGFVINDHIIATAAHCVYNRTNNNFVDEITVNIYNEQAEAKPENLIASFEAEAYHIPSLYLNGSGTYSHYYNYDYALLYVGTDSQGNDLLDYVSPWQFAIPSLEFSEAETGQLTTSGFTFYNIDNDDGDEYARFYSTGPVSDFIKETGATQYSPNLRIASLASNKGGKSGGPMYYTSTYNNTVNKSVAGISISIYTNSCTWGTKINPTLLRFYKQNPYI